MWAHETEKLPKYPCDQFSPKLHMKSKTLIKHECTSQNLIYEHRNKIKCSFIKNKKITGITHRLRVMDGSVSCTYALKACTSHLLLIENLSCWEPHKSFSFFTLGKISPPSSKGCKFIILATDYFTKWVEAKPM